MEPRGRATPGIIPDDAFQHLRVGGASLTLNSGYGHGFSVREVIEMVKRVSDVAFKVEVAPRRPGDPAQIVAACDRARMKLGWNPQYDDLATIIAHAHARYRANPQAWHLIGRSLET